MVQGGRGREWHHGNARKQASKQTRWPDVLQHVRPDDQLTHPACNPPPTPHHTTLIRIPCMQARLASPSQFMLCVGMAGWAKGQLAAELAAGCWHCVAAAPDLLLPRVPPPPVSITTTTTTCTTAARPTNTNTNTTTSSSSASPMPLVAPVRPIRPNAAPNGNKPRHANNSTSTNSRGATGAGATHTPHSSSGSSSNTSRVLRFTPSTHTPGPGVPPLQPPPPHPGGTPGAESCMWRRVLRAAQLM
jgi:hypothetical protein